MAEYVIAGNAAVDKITYADGTSTGFLPGGATLFALTGVGLWTDKVLMCGGFGEDYMEHMGEWLLRNHIDRSAFHVRDKKNPLNYMVYQDDGEWTSYTEYGNEHYDMLDCDPKKDGLEHFLEGVKGVYCFRDDNLEFFGQIKELKERFPFRLMWEIKAAICIPEKLEVIKDIITCSDAFSINRTEAYRLFSVDCDEEAIRLLKKLGPELIVYRVGKEGMYLITKRDELFVPSFKKYQVVDVTGCGNSSTAAAFYAWCEGMDLYEIGAVANVTAAINLRYQGAMELTNENKQLALSEAKAFASMLRGKGGGV